MSSCNETRQWLENLAPLSLFEPKDVPGSPATVRALLSRLAAHPSTSGFERVHHGLYFKQDEWPGIDYNVNDVVRAACRVAGPGGGMTGYTALNQLSWVWQVPNAVYLLTVADHLPQSMPLLPWVKWRQLPNAKHRLELSIAECTVLEAVRSAWFVEREWEDLLDEIADSGLRSRFWSTINRLQDGVRPDALREAAPLEKPEAGEIQCIEYKATDLSKPLSERIHDVATAIETRYRVERQETG